jgi:CheY-like chemotaxis protein
MDGEFSIDSELGKGSTFSFTVFLDKPEKGGAKPAIPNIEKVSILAVDDDPAVLEYFKDIGGRLGVSCDTADSGEAALGMAGANNYNMYFIDWKLPGMDGIELTRRIKEHGPGNAVVVMISSADLASIGREAREAGVDKFIAKPLFPSAVAEAVNEFVGSGDEGREDASAEQAFDFAGKTILLAEDVDINREIVVTVLAPTNISVVCAENGEAAVAAFAKSPELFSAIVMDVQMPVMDGLEATRQIRAIEAKAQSAKRVPIIAMTANVFREDIEKCIAAGMDGHVGKPLDFDEVFRTLGACLGD